MNKFFSIMIVWLVMIFATVETRAKSLYDDIPFSLSYDDTSFSITCVQEQCIIKDITVDRGKRKGRITVNFTENSYESNFGFPFSASAVLSGKFSMAQLELSTGSIIWLNCKAPNGYILTAPGMLQKYCSEDYHYLKLNFSDSVSFDIPDALEVNINEGAVVFRLNR